MPGLKKSSRRSPNLKDKDSEFLAIFDLDRTLVRKNTSFSFYFFLIRSRFLPLRTWFFSAAFLCLYKWGALDLPGLHKAVFNRILKGRIRSEIARFVPRFLDRFLPSCLHPEVLKRFQEAKQRGERTFLLSSSPDFLVGPVAERLGFDGWRGTEYAIDNAGRLCQISSLIEGTEKLRIAKAMRAKKTIAYSDSAEDLQLLEWAHEAVVVQPKKPLRKLALFRNWEILP